MRKADSLRRWLTAYLPDLKAHPDRLQIYIEGGAINARQSRSLSFTYGYTLKALVMDYAGDADAIMVPLLAWIEKEQPQLLKRSDGQPFTFEAELLDGDVSDIEISIELSEAVVVKLRADGAGYDIEHPPEPDFSDAFEGAPASFLQGFDSAGAPADPGVPDAALTSPAPPVA